MGGFTHIKIIANRMAAYHQKAFKKFCRVCGERISKNRVSFSCQKHADNIAQTFGVFCRDDSPDVYPPCVCHGCSLHCDQRQQQRRVNNAITVSRLSLGSVTPQQGIH
jgi:ribosomal protein L32